MAKDIGIDLGTANVLIHVKGKGIVLNEPSVVAIDVKQNNKVLAVGSEAYKMVGRTPGNIKVIRPLKGGVIADFDITEAMLSHFIDKLNLRGLFVKPNILICCPTNITTIEQKAIIEAAEKSGGRTVYLEEEPKVAAIGAGLNIFQPTGNLVIDMGGGTSDIAVLSMGGIVTSRSIKIAGDKFDQDIMQYIKQQHKLLIGDRTAEELKQKIGIALPVDDPQEMEIRGRDMVTGLPKSVTITANEVQSAIAESLAHVVNLTKEVLELTPPELAADIVDQGIVLTGGGAMISGLADLFAEQLKVPVLMADQPLNCVALGTGILLEHLQSKESWLERLFGRRRTKRK